MLVPFPAFILELSDVMFYVVSDVPIDDDKTPMVTLEISRYAGIIL
jgi:hypothetical protein